MSWCDERPAVSDAALAKAMMAMLMNAGRVTFKHEVGYRGHMWVTLSALLPVDVAETVVETVQEHQVRLR